MTNAKVKSVVLIARAFNDLDCRLPLIHALVEKYGYSAKILIVPTATSSGLTVAHEAAAGVAALDYFCAGLLTKFPKWVLGLGHRNLETAKHPLVRYGLWKLFWSMFVQTFANTSKSESAFIEYVGESIVIIDELLLTPDRSFIVPWINRLDKKKVFCVGHGQNTFINLWHERGYSNAIQNLHPDHARHHVYLSSENDKRILGERMPEVATTAIGNSRFDQDWVLRNFSQKAKEPGATVKVCFMMSKIDYGVSVQEMIDMINSIADAKGFEITLKPHTRGMSVVEFKSALRPSVKVETETASTQLIDQADIVLFSSSSIIFEAMIKQKKVLFLEAIQQYQTVFHDLPKVMRWTKGDKIIQSLTDLLGESNSDDALDAFVRKNAQNDLSDGRVCEHFIDNFILVERY